MNNSVETVLSSLGRILESQEGLNAENAARLIFDLRSVVYLLSDITTFPMLNFYFNPNQEINPTFSFPDGTLLLRNVPRSNQFGLKGIANLVFIRNRDFYIGWIITHDGGFKTSRVKVRDVGTDTGKECSEAHRRFVVVDSVEFTDCRESGLVSILPKSDAASFRYLLHNIVAEIQKILARYLTRAEERITKVREIQTNLKAFRAVLR